MLTFSFTRRSLSLTGWRVRWRWRRLFCDTEPGSTFAAMPAEPRSSPVPMASWQNGSLPTGLIQMSAMPMGIRRCSLRMPRWRVCCSDMERIRTPTLNSPPGFRRKVQESFGELLWNLSNPGGVKLYHESYFCTPTLGSKLQLPKGAISTPPNPLSCGTCAKHCASMT